MMQNLGSFHSKGSDPIKGLQPCPSDVCVIPIKINVMLLLFSFVLNLRKVISVVTRRMFVLCKLFPIIILNLVANFLQILKAI